MGCLWCHFKKNSFFTLNFHNVTKRHLTSTTWWNLVSVKCNKCPFLFDHVLMNTCQPAQLLEWYILQTDQPISLAALAVNWQLNMCFLASFLPLLPLKNRRLWSISWLSIGLLWECASPMGWALILTDLLLPMEPTSSQCMWNIWTFTVEFSFFQFLLRKMFHKCD